MTIDPTAGMTDAERAEYYHARDDTEEWDVAEAISRPARLDVTISVRFAAEEIAAIRERARDAGMKPTAFIRQAALDVEVPLNRGLLAKTFDRLRSDVEQLASMISIERGQKSTPRSGGSRRAGRPSATPTSTRVTRSDTGRTASKGEARSGAATKRASKKPAAKSGSRHQYNRTEKPK